MPTFCHFTFTHMWKCCLFFFCNTICLCTLTKLCSCIISDALSSQITVKYTPEMSSQMQTTWKRNCCPDSATFDFRPNENLKITEGGF